MVSGDGGAVDPEEVGVKLGGQLELTEWVRVPVEGEAVGGSAGFRADDNGGRAFKHDLVDHFGGHRGHSPWQTNILSNVIEKVSYTIGLPAL